MPSVGLNWELTMAEKREEEEDQKTLHVLQSMRWKSLQTGQQTDDLSVLQSMRWKSLQTGQQTDDLSVLQSMRWKSLQTGQQTDDLSVLQSMRWKSLQTGQQTDDLSVLQHSLRKAHDLVERKQIPLNLKQCQLSQKLQLSTQILTRDSQSPAFADCLGKKRTEIVALQEKMAADDADSRRPKMRADTPLKSEAAEHES
ncbi:hypothetical protein ACOMHN_007825 [Nucella lapillus]